MSNSTPPGWYPDPATPAHERFWDGRDWTTRTRPLGPVQPVAVPVSDASPAYGHPAVPEPVESLGYGFPPAAPVPVPASAPAPLYGYQPAPGYFPPPPARKRTGLIVGILAGALVLVVLTAGVCIAVLKGSARPAPSAARPVPLAPAPSPRASGPGSPSSPSSPSAPRSPSRPATPPGSAAPVAPDGASVLDAAHGWTVPLPAGWTSEAHDAATSVLLATGPYDCPTPGGCVRGNFSIDTATTAGTDAQTVARQAMDSYAPQLFGPLAAHQELTSGPLTVAGLPGYAVRWHVVPQQAAQGFLLLIALPAPGGGFTTLVGSVDDDPKAPLPAVLDQIATGLRSATPANAA
ncbi:DUF2510 domain-containing protein [Kitasatospora azatica]|uniref:DUF2510 domain-containing protein n=1 Tax=Kitasatospora azatica TaxID=58347 RepID=UPI0005606CC6|nr:DUF2510 domain-containing protein [Kitasatospora azatica]